MARKYTVIGHFDCGCGQAAQPESLELVLCKSRDEVEQVVDRMKQHSAGHQCWQAPAMAVVTVPGEPEILHQVKQLPEAYILFPDSQAYVKRHEDRKTEDREWGRTTRVEGMERLRREHSGADDA